MKHCCLKMEGALEEPFTPLKYVSYARGYSMEYGTQFKNEESGEIVAVLAEPLFYCPWCGTQLPKNLFEEWAKVLKKEFKIGSPLYKEKLKKIPKEYMTEEWWQKRGL